jgi:hypothetical protein
MVLRKPFLTNTKLSIMGQDFEKYYCIGISLRTRVIDYTLKSDPSCAYT